ncbi:dynein regulatory complex subunit 7-like [Diretmus argenteus]
MHIVTPELLLPSWTKEVDLSQCPASYTVNRCQEVRLLAIADHFCNLYMHFFPDRKPLLVCPVNECGIKKFVSTTLRCTQLPYPEFCSWEGCASFVADHLTLEPLEPPFDPPRFLFSPTLVLQSQRGTCFDFSTLLCSLLLGAGYNAYCVSGYATKQMCLQDKSLQEFPLLATEVKDMTTEQKPQNNAVKTPRELKSRFEKRQEEKKQAEANTALLEKQQEAQRLQEESERPPPDMLLGWRVHCWVLVLSGSCGVPEDFFIDPLTGRGYSTTDENFLGIASIWNHENYWANMQDRSRCCTDLVYDLENTMMWESVLHDSTNQPMHSWVSEITLKQQDLETRWPEGVKTIQYRKTKQERFAPYLRPDGLVTRLTTYKDLDCTHASVVKEWYRHRHDHLEERELNKDTNVTTERFRPAQRSVYSLKSHRYVTLTAETEREMEFDSCIRVDRLVRRVELPLEMTETFQDRDDFLYYRHVVFGQHVQLLRPGETPELGSRPIQEVVERFHRNRSKPADEDMAERVFLLAEERIKVTYHLVDDGNIPARRNFIKPREATETQKAQDFTRDMVSGYQRVDPFTKDAETQHLHMMLLDLLKEEKEVIPRIRDSEKEVRAILASRKQEESSIELHVTIDSSAGIEKAHRQREDMECLAEEEHQSLQKEMKDILAHFLVELDNPETLSQSDAVQLHQDCMAYLQHILIDKANLMRAHVEKEKQELQQKQQWYQQNQTKMTKEDKDKYLAYCAATTSRIHVLELRLSRHKDTATQKYLALDAELRQDPRLAPHFL